MTSIPLAAISQHGAGLRRAGLMERRGYRLTPAVFPNRLR